MSLPAPLSPARHNLAPGRPTRLACSAVDLLWVMSYAPSEGVHGTPISVNFACRADLPGIHIRLVVGRRAVSTHVREIDAGHWQLIGHAPAFAKHKSDVPMLPLTIQAVDRENRVVDSVTFGDFVYHRSPRPALRIAPDTRSPYTQPLTPASSDSEHGSPRHTPALRRASRQMGADPDDPARTVLLDITTALDSFCYDWDDSELNAGRRLVRFRRLQDGNRLIVSPERISQAEYDPDDIVISCIYRQETDACCVTSVDIIHLLQRLVEADFEVDEKNRIRRNLEGLRPTTVSKTRPGFESFFQRIMDFPDPKPRKIEKDVKVFDWKLLPHALDKILSKYSLCASPAASSPSDTRPSPSVHTMMPQAMPTAPPSSGGAYGDPSFQLPHEPHTNALYLSHAHLTQFPSPDASPELHRRSSLPEDQLQSIYLDTEIMRRYFSVDQDVLYTLPPPSAPLHSPMYTAEPPALLAHDTAFVDWTTPTTNDVMLMPPQDPIYSPVYGYSHSDSAESVNIHASLSYPLNTYDSFEFQTLREHHMNAATASQRA